MSYTNQIKMKYIGESFFAFFACFAFFDGSNGITKGSYRRNSRSRSYELKGNHKLNRCCWEETKLDSMAFLPQYISLDICIYVIRHSWNWLTFRWYSDPVILLNITVCLMLVLVKIVKYNHWNRHRKFICRQSSFQLVQKLNFIWLRCPNSDVRIL